MDGNMEDADVAEECITQIKKGDREKWMATTDANNAMTVKEKFGLDYEPACVYFHRGHKKIKTRFGNLKSDTTYYLEDPNKIPDQASHVLNALWMSNAAYGTDPVARLQATVYKHSIHTVHAVSQHSDQGVIIAVGNVDGKDTLYVAYKGTTTWKDAIIDADIAMQNDPNVPGGRFHSGFNKRSKQTVRVKDILHCASTAGCETIITCGHSLGGAVSSISALDLLHFLGKDPDFKVNNITFGAPFFANEAVRKFCKDEDLDKHLLHYVSCDDIVPGLLSLGHTSRIVSEKLPGRIWIIQSFLYFIFEGAVYAGLGIATSFLTTAVSIADNIFGQEESNGKQSDLQILSDAAATILKIPRETGLGKT